MAKDNPSDRNEAILKDDRLYLVISHMVINWLETAGRINHELLWNESPI